MEAFRGFTAFDPAVDFTGIFVWKLVVVISCAKLLSRVSKPLWSENALPLPPGPSRIPLLGNLYQFPGRYLWLTYRKWHKLYGPIISLKYGQRTVVVLPPLLLHQPKKIKHGKPESLTNYVRPQASGKPRCTVGWQCNDLIDNPLLLLSGQITDSPGIFCVHHVLRAFRLC